MDGNTLAKYYSDVLGIKKGHQKHLHILVVCSCDISEI